MGKLIVRNCPRCRKGEIFFDKDEYGWYECCLQCGYSRDLPNLAQPVAVEWKNGEKESLPLRRTGRLHNKGV
jgi:hypothetical protein